MNATAALANITVYDLNLTDCSKLALGLSIYHNTFNNSKLDDTSFYYTQNYYDTFYPNGPSADWTTFWRATLGSKDQNFSSDDVNVWANDSFFFDFFNTYYYWPLPDQLDQLATDLVYWGGCPAADPNMTLNAFKLTSMVESCILSYCCASGLTDQQLQDNTTSFPFYPVWGVDDACAFRTCPAANHGNPDLGGIGIIIAYAIEAGLLGVACVIYTFGWIPRRMFRLFRRQPPRLLARHDLAVLMSSAVFLDSACYFALSVCFAGIIFNGKAPLLYEDKLGQASTLLAVNPPVSILLMTYTKLDRKNFRATLVLIAAVMTFIIQFLFRKSQSFEPSSSVCLDWKANLETDFLNLFIVKAAWAVMVILFVISHFIPWTSLARNRQNVTPYRVSRFERLKTSRIGAKVSDLCLQIHWRQSIAVLLGLFGFIDCVYDIMFIQLLRSTESRIASVNLDKEWGYGQILALFIWVPVIVQYFYVLAFGRSGEWSRDEHDHEGGAGKVHEYAAAPNAEKGVSPTIKPVNGHGYTD